MTNPMDGVMNVLDFNSISNEELAKMQEERAEWISKCTNDMVYEGRTDNKIINDLMFNHGYIYLRPYIIHGQNGDKLELAFLPNTEPDTVFLHMIMVLEHRRNQGHGKELMNLLIDLSKKYGYKQIKLQVSSNFGVSAKYLRDFYKKFGFVRNEDKDDLILNL